MSPPPPPPPLPLASAAAVSSGVQHAHAKIACEANALQALWLRLHALEHYLKGLLPNSCEKSSSSQLLNKKKKKRIKEEQSHFQMPVHYPRYSRADYMEMPEWKLDCLFREYGLPLPDSADLAQKRQHAIGHFVWPLQL